MLRCVVGCCVVLYCFVLFCADGYHRIIKDSDVYFFIQMTRLVLPGMVERYCHKNNFMVDLKSYDCKYINLFMFVLCLLPRGTGLIINISSETGVHPQPLLSLYSATKVPSFLFRYCYSGHIRSNML